MKGKQKKKRTNWKLVGEFMRGSYKHFLLGAIGLLVAVLTSYLIPQITGFTIDYVLIEHAEVGYTGEMVVAPWLENIINSIGGRGFLESHLYIMGIALILVTALNAYSSYIRTAQIAYGSEIMNYNMRTKLYSHLIAMPYDYFKHVSSGDILQRCTSDVGTIGRFVQNQLLGIIRTVVMVVIAIIFMLNMNVKLTLYSVVLMPLIIVIAFVYFKNVTKYFTHADESEGRLSACIQENVSGMRVVRAFGQQKNELDNFTEHNLDYSKKAIKLNDHLSFFWGGTDMLGYMQIAISLCAGVVMAVNKQISIGELTIFASYTSMLVWPVRQLGRMLADLGKAGVSLGRLEEILVAPVEREPGLALKPEIAGNVEFRNVSFGYEDGQEVLKDVSFTAKRGETIAILGSTGSGKSSLVQLIQRLYSCTGGEILIDGTNINDIEQHHLRKNVGIVMQEPFLYSRTIMENIRITNPSADEQSVYDMAKIAAVHDAINEFENGYDTVVGERGVTLSGGQKQRVAIARMLMQQAPIIVLDDSMSAVDTQTDAAIRDALQKGKHDCTTFIISHRITTLCKADKILVLDKGRLVQEGTHDELLKQEGLYKRVAEIQNLLEDEFIAQEVNG